MILPSVRAFLSGIIDYAGLFPPAKLPLDKAIHNYATYRKGSDAWMLGRFIIPAARLAELDAFAHLFSSGPPFTFSVLGRGGETIETFQANIETDREAVAAFRSRHGAAVLVDAFEVKLPAEAILNASRRRPSRTDRDAPTCRNERCLRSPGDVSAVVLRADARRRGRGEAALRRTGGGRVPES